MAKGPVTDEERKRIVEVFKTCDSVRETARQVGRSATTVSGVVKLAGLEPSGRKFVKQALAANQDDAKARRARLAQKWRQAEEQTLDLVLGVANGEREYHLVKGTGSGKVIDQHVKAVPADDRKNLLTGAAIASDKAGLLERADQDTEGRGKGLLQQLVEGLSDGVK